MKYFGRFLTVGLLNTLIGYCIIFACMYLAKLSPEVSNFIGYGVGLTISYSLNRKFTFNSNQNRRSEVIRFLVVFLVSYAANYAILLGLIHLLSLNPGVSQVLAGIAYVIASFFLNKYYVFNTKTASLKDPHCRTNIEL